MMVSKEEVSPLIERPIMETLVLLVVYLGGKTRAYGITMGSHQIVVLKEGDSTSHLDGGLEEFDAPNLCISAETIESSCRKWMVLT
jgi:hypothetical protein